MDTSNDKFPCCSTKKGCCAQKLKKLNTFDWLCDLPEAQQQTDWVEVQFKNTRKSYFLNSNKIPLIKGDIVAVESNPGHDIGEVTLTGALVLKQMKKNNYRTDQQEVRRVYRKARPIDMDKFAEAKAREHETMLKSRTIAEDLKLNMKIGDVEYQGDGNKAIFYYIADDRVDFRQLIRVLADTFKVRIEMKQIGARQEAGRIGGVGPCGRELCCSSWMTNFISVSTSAARYQDLSMNPQKLAGQCAKLKCCLNYEIDTYVESSRDFPAKDITLETVDNTYYLFKSDILKRTMIYSTSKDFPANEVTLPVERVRQIIQLNRKGIKVDNLSEIVETKEKLAFGDILSEDGLDRFDKARKPKNKKFKDKRNKPQEGQERFQGERDRPQRDKTPQPDNKPQAGNWPQTGNRPQAGNRPQGNKPQGNNKSRFEKPKRNPSEGQNPS